MSRSGEVERGIMMGKKRKRREEEWVGEGRAHSLRRAGKVSGRGKSWGGNNSKELKQTLLTISFDCSLQPAILL